MEQNKYFQLLGEVFGSSYVELIRKTKENGEANIRNWKLTTIEDINRAKKLMGFNICVDDEFFKLYDKEPEELAEIQDFYWEEARKQTMNKNGTSLTGRIQRWH